MDFGRAEVWLPQVITGLVLLMKFTLGFNTRLSYLTYFKDKWQLLLGSVFVAVLLPPVIGLILVNLFQPGVLVSSTLLLLAAAPGAPLSAFKVFRFDGSYSFGISLQILLIVLSVFTLPLTLEIYNRYFQLGITAHWLDLSRQIATVVVLPMLIGFLLGRLMPDWVEKYGIVAGNVVNRIMVAFMIPMLWLFRESFLSLTAMDYIMFLMFVTILYGTGHCLGGSSKKHRISLAIVSASRHLGICLFLAVQSYGQMALLQVLVPYAIVNIMLGIVYNRLVR